MAHCLTQVSSVIYRNKSGRSASHLVTSNMENREEDWKANKQAKPAELLGREASWSRREKGSANTPCIPTRPDCSKGWSLEIGWAVWGVIAVVVISKLKAMHLSWERHNLLSSAQLDTDTDCEMHFFCCTFPARLTLLSDLHQWIPAHGI